VPKLRILLIDDEVNLCRMIKLNLERTGAYEVATVFSGEEGVARAAAERFDLVITDFRMPGMDGGQVVQAIKAATPDLPVILSSVYHDDPKTISPSTDRQADGLISKPIDHVQLQQVIRDVLARRGRRNA
jgi:CheY-like chemotaxis protein